MEQSSAAGLRCPHCRQPLMLVGTSLRCPRGHCYDLAKEGYANLLEVQQKHSKTPGDSREMVEARRRFLGKGHYAPFTRALADLARIHCPTGGHIVDAGCGEGNYTAAVHQAVEGCALIGFDLAKPAVRLAAKALPDAAFCVATSYDIPIRDAWTDLLLNIFSPWAGEEFHRILKSGGKLIYAVPTARHLYGMKEVLYQKPYLNEEKEVAYPGFRFVEEVRVEAVLHLEGQDIADLFAMTPYYWKTPKDGSQRLAALEVLDTDIGFRFLVFEKE